MFLWAVGIIITFRNGILLRGVCWSSDGRQEDEIIQCGWPKYLCFLFYLECEFDLFAGSK
jgi:hypothetical protein